MAKSKSKAAQVEQRRRQKKKPTSIVKKNPFEVRVNKEKYSILGRKTKNDKGLPGLSRSKAIKKRKKTLLEEFKQGNKKSLFVDKRFGEYNNEMSLEEKMLQRFTMEKQKHHKSRGYNLDDDEELTHYGQSLGDLENFDDADLKLTDDEQDDEKIDDTHFGGFLEKADKPYHQRNEDSQPKSRKEIMEEVVAKSKLKKMERQQAKEEAFTLTQNLDSDWKSVYKLLPKREESSKMKAADDYDVLVRELLYETKAKPTGKMKTEEEIAKEELEKLQKLEEERLNRMVSEEAKKTQHVSADDLGESIIPSKDDRFELTYKDGKMVLPEGVDSLEINAELDDDDEGDSEIDGGDGSEDDASNDEEDDDNDDDDDDDGEEEDDDVNIDDEDDDDDEDDGVDGDRHVDDDVDVAEDIDQEMTDKITNDRAKLKYKENVKEGMKQDKASEVGKAEKELPYTFEAPKNMEDFMKCIDGWNYEQQLLIIERIRKCHPPKLEASNKKKMEAFFGIILSYIDHLCDQSPIPVEFINKLSKPIFQLANDSPHHAAREIQRRLRLMFKRFWVRRQKSGGRNAVPGLKEIFLLGIISNIFPTSDLRHAVTTPAMIYVAAVLHKSYFQKSSDVLSGLFLANIILEFVSLSKRFVPEVINYLTGVLSMATMKDKSKYRTLFRIHMKGRHCLLLENKSKNNTTFKSRLSDIENLQEDLSNCSENFKISTVRTCLHLTKSFISLYKDLPSFAEIFTPVQTCIDAIPIQNYPKEMQTNFDEVLQSLDVTMARQPLTLQARKPVPLPLLEPQFDEQYEIKPKRRATNKDANEREKLKYKYKKEMKGAIREIRKDSHFLAKEKLKEKLARDAERERKTKEIQSQLAEQQGELNALEKVKKKKR